MITMRHAYAEIHFRSGGAQHFLPITDRFDADRDQRSVDRRNTATKLHLDAVGVIGYDYRPGEPDRVRDHSTGITYPVGDDSKRSSHGEHPVCDDTGQAHPAGEVLRVMDRIEIGRSPGVPNQPFPSETHRHRRQRGADLNALYDGRLHNVAFTMSPAPEREKRSLVRCK